MYMREYKAKYHRKLTTIMIQYNYTLVVVGTYTSTGMPNFSPTVATACPALPPLDI